MTLPLKGYVIQNSGRAGQPCARYYLLAHDEAEARGAAAALLGAELQHISVLRDMANWEVEVFCPFPNELISAP